MRKLITDWFTERDGTSWCIGRAMAAAAFASMIFKFIQASSADFQGFAIGVAAVIAAVAGKNYSERG